MTSFGERGRGDETIRVRDFWRRTGGEGSSRLEEQLGSDGGDVKREAWKGDQPRGPEPRGRSLKKLSGKYPTSVVASG
jgi:hypothetical protein